MTSELNLDRYRGASIVLDTWLFKVFADGHSIHMEVYQDIIHELNYLYDQELITGEERFILTEAFYKHTGTNANGN